MSAMHIEPVDAAKIGDTLTEIECSVPGCKNTMMLGPGPGVPPVLAMPLGNVHKRPFPRGSAKMAP